MDKLASTSWPVARAQVVEFEQHRNVKSGAWCAQLRYRYLVGGETFTSTRWSLATRVTCYRHQQAAGALASRFRPGAGIGIRYDPADPETAIVYLADPAFSDFIFLIFAAILLAAAIRILGSRKA